MNAIIKNINDVSLESLPVYKMSSHIDDIIKPLKRFGITHFTVNYNRKYGKQNNTMEVLTNMPEIFKIYVDDKYYHHLASGFPDDYVPGYFMWSDISYGVNVHSKVREFSSILYNSYNIGSGIDIVKTYEDRTEIYFFAGPSYFNGILLDSLFLNHMDILERFILYFQNVAAGIIKQATLQRCFFGDGNDSTYLTSKQFKQCLTEKKIFTNSIGLHKLETQNLYKYYSLTTREQQCAQLILQGLTAKEMAREIQISPRTIEKHIVSLRRKTNSKSIKQLIINLSRET